MWLLRVFEAAFVRKVAYVLAAALLGLLLAYAKAHADAPCYQWQVTSGAPSCSPGSDPVAVAQCFADWYVANSALSSFTITSCDVSGAPTALGQGTNCTGTQVCDPSKCGCGSCVSGTFLSSVAGPCPTACSAAAGQYNYMASSSFIAPGGTTCGSDGCSYNASTMNANRQGLVQGDPTTLQVMISTGQSCSGGGTATPVATVIPGVPSQACTSSGASTLCMGTTANGTANDTVNGTLSIVPAQVQPGTCSSTSGGGAACSSGGAPTSSIQSPPAPDNGTAGTAATPVAVLSESGNNVAVYSAAQVQASKGTVQTGSGLTTAPGSKTGSGAGGTGTGAGPGTGDSASGGGDCATPPVCSGDAINCSILNQAWLDRCANTSVADIASAVALTSGETPFSSTSDQSGALSEVGPISGNAGQCPGPIVFTWMGKTVSWEIWAWLCQFAAQASLIVMTVAYLAGARVWLGALLQ